MFRATLDSGWTWATVLGAFPTVQRPGHNSAFFSAGPNNLSESTPLVTSLQYMIWSNILTFIHFQFFYVSPFSDRLWMQSY